MSLKGNFCASVQQVLSLICTQKQMQIHFQSQLQHIKPHNTWVKSKFIQSGYIRAPGGDKTFGVSLQLLVTVYNGDGGLAQ
jgi:hypothetical protein